MGTTEHGVVIGNDFLAKIGQMSINYRTQRVTFTDSEKRKRYIYPMYSLEEQIVIRSTREDFMIPSTSENVPAGTSQNGSNSNSPKVVPSTSWKGNRPTTSTPGGAPRRANPNNTGVNPQRTKTPERKFPFKGPSSGKGLRPLQKIKTTIGAMRHKNPPISTPSQTDQVIDSKVPNSFADLDFSDKDSEMDLGTVAQVLSSMWAQRSSNL